MKTALSKSNIKNNALQELRLNPDWVKLPLFDRKGWTRYRFGEIAEIIRESVQPTPADSLTYIGLEHMDTGSLHVRRWGSEADLKGQKLRMRKGDILFAKRNAYLRRVAIAPHDGLFSAHGMILRAKSKVILPEFLPFFMMGDKFMNRAEQISVGSLSPTINWSTLKNEEFDLPPITQQNRITEILLCVDKTSFACDSAIDSTNDAINALLDNAFGTSKDAFPGKRHPVTELASAARLQTGIAKGKKYPSTIPTIELPYLRVANVQDGYLDLTEIKTIVIQESDIARFKLLDGDVVICEGGDFDQVGRGVIWRNQVPHCLHQNHVFCLRADRKLLIPEFLALQLRSTYGKRYFLGCAKKTSNLASINSTQVKAFPLQLPPITAQQHLVSEVDKLQFALNAFVAHKMANRKLLNDLIEAVT